jgi:anaphase-promoting complex subunit 7
MTALALNTTGLVAARLPRKASRGTTGRRSLVTRAAAADDDEKPTARSVLSFLCPLLKVFGGGDAAAPRNRTLEVATSGFASIARLPFGSKVDEACIARPAGAVPKEPIILYEFEACPFCRRVREALSQLDLTVEVRPCPKDAVKHRTEVEAMGGKLTFPFLVDPNTEAGEGGLYESEDICRYLYATYGNGAEFPEGIISTTVLTGWMPTLLRAGRGMTRYANATTHAGAADLKPLTLFNYEGNQFTRLAREALCELELPYTLFNCGKGSPKRATLTDVAGEGASVPYLVDPNTGQNVGESEEIVAYLFKTYGGAA